MLNFFNKQKKAEKDKLLEAGTSAYWTIEDHTAFDISPSCNIVLDYLESLVIGLDYDNPTNYSLDNVSLAFKNIMVYGFAIFSNGNRCIKYDTRMQHLLKYNSYGDIAGGQWLDFFSRKQNIKFVIQKGNGILNSSKKELCTLENVIYQRANDYIKNRMFNGAVVSAPNANPAKLEQISQDIQKAMRAGGTIVTGSPLESIQLNHGSITDFIDKDVLIAIRNMVVGCFGMSPDVIFTDNSNRSTSETSSNNIIRFSVYPLVWFICEKLQQNGINISVRELVEQEIEGDATSKTN